MPLALSSSCADLAAAVVSADSVLCHSYCSCFELMLICAGLVVMMLQILLILWAQSKVCRLLIPIPESLFSNSGKCYGSERDKAHIVDV